MRDGLIRSGTNELHLTSATWKNGVFRGDDRVETSRTDIVHARFSKKDVIHLHAAVPELETETQLRLENKAGDLSVSGHFLWRTNQLAVSAQFGSEGLLPKSARIESGALSVPGRELRLTNYHDLTCSFVADWNGTNFYVDLSAKAEPRTNSLPPLQAALRARGNTNAVLIETFKVMSPCGKAELSKNVEVSGRDLAQ